MLFFMKFLRLWCCGYCGCDCAAAAAKVFSRRPGYGVNRTPSCGCDSAAVATAAAAAVAAAVRGEAAGILEKSHKVEKNWKKFNLKQYFQIFYLCNCVEVNLEQDLLNEDFALTFKNSVQRIERNVFSLRTFCTSVMSSFVTFEFENIISYIKILCWVLCWGLISPPIFLNLWFFYN